MLAHCGPAARDVFGHAQRRALGFSHAYLGPEHLLLGLMEVADPAIDAVFARLDQPRERVTAAIAALVQRAAPLAAMPLPFTPEARKVLELAHEAMQRLGAPEIGPVHLLLGVIQEPESLAAQALVTCGWDPGSARTWVLGHERDRRPVPAAVNVTTLLANLEEILESGIAQGLWTRDYAQRTLADAARRLA